MRDVLPLALAGVRFGGNLEEIPPQSEVMDLRIPAGRCHARHRLASPRGKTLADVPFIRAAPLDVDGGKEKEEGIGNMTKFVRKVPLICIAAMVAALALAPAALASSSVETYAGGGGNTQANVQSGGPGATDPTASATTGALPFTGFDLTLAFGGALLLLAGGASLAALSRNQRARQD